MNRLNTNYRGIPDEEYKQILHYSDHHSGFFYVVPLKNKSSKEVGQALLIILSAAVIPEVLKSDNGKEVSGYYLALIREYFKTIRIVKGRPYHPQSDTVLNMVMVHSSKYLQNWLIEGGDSRKSIPGVELEYVNTHLL
jgi:hypothetical protein